MGKNGDIVTAVYDAFGKGDVPAVLGAFDPQIRWREAESLLYADGNPYVGSQAVLDGVFHRILLDVEHFAVLPERFVEGDDAVVAEGRYRGDDEEDRDGPRRAVRAYLAPARRQGRPVSAVHRYQAVV